MFQFPPFAPLIAVHGLQPCGFPHSDMHGSTPVCGSPCLFAAYHVLPRFRKPRHPPFALPLFLSYSKTVNHYFKFFFAYEIVALKTKIFISIANHNFCFFFTSFSLSVLSKNNPFSQRGCKDTHFFDTCKYFEEFFRLMNARKQIRP